MGLKKNSLSDSFLVYRKANYFGTLFFLYTTSIWNAFISSSTFLVETLGFSMYIISPNEDGFTSSFPI